MRWTKNLIVVALASAVVSTAWADPTLSLTTDNGATPLGPGDTFDVTLSMSNLGGGAVAGFQAFLGFDPVEVTFVGGSYTSTPFALHVLDPITAVGNEIALAAGIDPATQTTTSADADLVTLTFQAVAGGCVTSIDFVSHVPPTTLSDDQGQPIGPLVLESLGGVPTAGLALSVQYSVTPVEPSDLLLVTVSMGELCAEEAAGFQAFLTFDPAVVTFVSGAYTGAPFGQPVIMPITAVGNEIDLAAGINIPGGQLPTSAAADLALLTFESVNGGCFTSVEFRPNAPPTRLTDPLGDEILPLTLTGLPVDPCFADINCDRIVDVLDLLELLSRWGDPGGPADINMDGTVDVLDLLALLTAWGPCPP